MLTLIPVSSPSRPIIPSVGVDDRDSEGVTVPNCLPPSMLSVALDTTSLILSPCSVAMEDSAGVGGRMASTTGGLNALTSD